MPRFVILEHDHPTLHWDFMLESGDHLQTWRLSAIPKPGLVIPAEASFNHRLLYLDYEGPISGGRGTVRRWDHGTFAWIDQDEACLKISLQGQRLRGIASLTPAGWLFGS